MKKKILTIATCLTLGGLANAQNVNIPDANFKNALLAHGASAPVNGVNPITGAGISLIDANNDGDISTTEAQNYTGTIQVNNRSISDLTGIEAFTNTTFLYCQQNQLTSLNISTNTALTELWCFSNQLTSLDVSANTNLLKLYCDNNELTSLNVANGNNGTNYSSNLSIVNATNNSNLACIQHDAGFNPSATSDWTKDATASWSSTPCPPPSCVNIVNIPDANFKNALINHSPTIDTDGDGEICLTEAQAYTGTIDVSSKSISDLTGIEAFVNATNLNCGHNQLTSLNISANTALTELYCRNNQLTSLDVSTNTALTIIHCRDNQLTNLDVSTNTSLIALVSHNNQLTSLDVSANTALQSFYCQNNQLTNLDVSANTALLYFSCFNNSLTSLNVANGNNGISSSNLHIVTAFNNPNLTCIQHDTGFDPTTASQWQKDATAQWSDNCSGGGTPASNIMYVDKNATGSNNGTSWANAFTNLQTALTNVTANGQIWMAKGTYLPSTTQNRYDFYSIDKDGVTVYGGFAGTETSLADRDMSLIHTTNATILSGDLNGNDDGNMSFANSSKTDNSFHIIEIIANKVTLDGLTVSDGYADATSGHGRLGAGIWVVETKKDFTLKNSRVKNNTALWATGMVYNPNISDSTKLTIDACIFENNLASSSCASFYCYNKNAGSKLIVEVTNSLFNGNQTMDDATLNRQAYGTPAGWIRAYEAGTTIDVSLVNNTFVNNVSKGTNTNAIDFPTFGLTKRNGNFGTINVANNIFWGNTTNGDTTSHAFGNVTTTDVSMPTFNIYNSIDEKGFSNIGSSNLTNTSNSNPNLTADFKLQAGSPAIDAGDNTKLPSGITTDLAGNNRISNTTVDMGCYEYINTSGIEENTISMTVYPNPTNGKVTIDTDVEISSVEVYSLSGQRVASFSEPTFSIEMLKSGVYFVKVLSDDGSFTTRIIKE